MSAISELVAEGNLLLTEIGATFVEGGDPVTSAQAVRAKSLHTKGKFLLRNIDRATYQEYCALFFKTTDQIGDWHKWSSYLTAELEKCVGILEAVQDSATDALDKSIPQVFISHGRFTDAFRKLEIFIRALGCTPIYDQNEPTEGQTINQHIEKLFAKSDFYVILATGETRNDKGQRLPNHNVIIEFDRLQRDQARNLLVLLEDGTEMPSMLQDVIRQSFSQACMDIAFTKPILELKKCNLI